MTTTVITETKCPVCGHKLNRATDAFGDHKAEPGDLTVCFYCASFLKFTDDMTHQELTGEEVAALDADTRKSLLRVRAAIMAQRGANV